MKCLNCGFENPENASFCSYCGAKIEAKKIVFCSKCGSKNNNDSRYCSKCGEALFGNYSNDETDGFAETVVKRNGNSTVTTTITTNSQTSNGSSNKNKGLFIGLIAVIAAIFIIILIANGNSKDSDTKNSKNNNKVSNVTTELTNKEESTKPQKDGFNVSSNNNVTVGKFSFSIPDYWKSDINEPDSYRAYAETSGKVAMLQIILSYDDEDTVTYDLLKKEHEEGLMSQAVESWFDSCKVTKTESFSNGNIKGFIYYFNYKADKLDGNGALLCFPSESDNKWAYVVLAQAGETKYLYDNDYKKIIDSISPASEEAIKENKNKITIGYASKDFLDKDVNTVGSIIQIRGFTNVTYKPIEDLITGWITPDGSVEEVSINGKTEFTKNDSFNSDSTVVISYHTFKNENGYCSDGLPHVVVEDKGYDKTCTKTGKTDGMHCSRCNKVLKKQETIPPCHTVVVDAAVKATKGHTGLTEGKHCSVCGEIIVEQQVAYFDEADKYKFLTMPVMKGSSLDNAVKVAKEHGLSQSYSDEDWGYGTKMRPLNNKNASLTIDIVYSTSTKEVLVGSIVTDNRSSLDEQKAFIIAMASVLCPSSDKETVLKWVKSNVGSSAKTTIGGFVYEVAIGTTGQYLFFAGEKNWEEWTVN